jgi:hypothetical protein
MTLPFGENNISDCPHSRRLKGESKENLNQKGTRVAGMDRKGLT